MIRDQRKEHFDEMCRYYEELKEDGGYLEVDDDEDWNIPNLTSNVRRENSAFRKYMKIKKGDDEIQTAITEVLCKDKDSSAEDVIDFPESDEEDENYDPDVRNSSDEEEEEEDKGDEHAEESQDQDSGEKKNREEDEVQSESGGSEPSQKEDIPNDEGRDSPKTILSAAGGRADLSMGSLLVDDEFHRGPEEPAEGDWFKTPQNPKASFLSAGSSSSSGEFFSPGKKRGLNSSSAEAAMEADKDEYLLMDTLICNADNCKSGRLTNLPEIYCKNGTLFMCNQCLLEASGHADCMREGCQICQIVGQELSKRLQMEKSFREGSLILEETISTKPDKTEYVLSR